MVAMLRTQYYLLMTGMALVLLVTGPVVNPVHWSMRFVDDWDGTHT